MAQAKADEGIVIEQPAIAMRQIVHNSFKSVNRRLFWGECLQIRG